MTYCAVVAEIIGVVIGIDDAIVVILMAAIAIERRILIAIGMAGHAGKIYMRPS